MKIFAAVELASDALLPVPPVAMVTERTLPSSTCRTNSEYGIACPVAVREPPPIIWTMRTSANSTPTQISRLFVQGFPGFLSLSFISPSFRAPKALACKIGSFGPITMRP